MVAFVILSCGQTSQNESGKRRVVTSLGILADAVKVITEYSVEVTGLLVPGEWPHVSNTL